MCEFTGTFSIILMIFFCMISSWEVFIDPPKSTIPGLVFYVVVIVLFTHQALI